MCWSAKQLSSGFVPLILPDGVLDLPQDDARAPVDGVAQGQDHVFGTPALTRYRLRYLPGRALAAIDSLKGHVLYINVMDCATIESAGVILPDSNTYGIGVLASYDPVALDQACIDLVSILGEGAPLLSHIEACGGLYALAYGEQVGLGSRTYALTVLDN